MGYILEEFCQLFDLPLDNCTCSNQEIAHFVQKELGLCINDTKPGIKEVYSSSKATLPYAILALVISTIGLIGNGLVIFVAIAKRNEISNCQKIIGYLAASDFGYALVQIIVAVPSLWTHEWLYGTGMCKILHTAESLGGILAIGFVVVITTERYIGIVRPLVTLTRKRLFIMVCLNIAFCSISLVPYFIYLTVNKHMLCVVEWPNINTPYIYESYMLSSTALFPIVLILVLYGKVIYALKSLVNDKDMKESLTRKSYKRKVQETRKIMRVVIALLIAFAILVIPNRSIALYLYTNEVFGTTYNILSCISLLTYPCHVTINPILYNMIDKRWRQSLKQLLCCCKQKSKSLYKHEVVTSDASTKGFRRSGNTSIGML